MFLEYLLLIDDKIYGPMDCLVNGIDSLHIYGSADPLVEHCRREVNLYVNSPETLKDVIVHDGGHKVLNKFSREHLDVIEKFMMYQFNKANGLE